MGFMGNYYGGPDPYAAAIEKAVSGFFEGYSKMKGIGLEESRMAEEKRRTALQEASLQETTRHQQVLEGFQQQQLGQAETGLAYTREQTKALQDAARRKELSSKLIAGIPEVGDMGEAVRPEDRMRWTADALRKAGLHEEAIAYDNSAVRSEQLRMQALQLEQTGEMHKAQMALMAVQQKEKEEAMRLADQEKEGYRKAIAALGPKLKEWGFPEMSPETPFPVIKEIFDLTTWKQRIEVAGQDVKDKVLENLRSEINSLEGNLSKYLTITPSLPLPKEQEAAMKEAASNIQSRLVQLRKMEQILVEGKYPALKPKPEPPMEKRQLPQEYFTEDVGATKKERPTMGLMGGGVAHRGALPQLGPSLGSINTFMGNLLGGRRIR